MINRFILTLSLITTTCFRLNPTGPTHRQIVVNCLTNLIEDKLDEDTVNLIIFLVNPLLSTSGFMIQNCLLKKLNNLLKVTLIVNNDEIKDNTQIKLFIMILDNFENFQMDFFTQMYNFNAKTWIVLYYSNLEADHTTKTIDILDYFWQKFIYNVLIVAPETLQKLTLITAEHRLQSQNSCLQNYKLINSNSCSLKKSLPVYNFSNCTVSIIANKIDPFVISPTEGFEIDFVKEVAKILNISLKITLTGEDSWGVVIDGNWTYGLGEIQNKNFLGIGNFYAVPEYSKDFDFTIPHFVSNLVWFVPIAAKVPQWKVVFTIFSWYLWILSIGLILLCASLFRLLSTENERVYQNFTNGFLSAYYIFIIGPVPTQPRSDWPRLVFISLAIFSIIISSLYTSKLIQMLTRSQREPQVDTIEKVIEKGWDVGGLPEYENIFHTATDEKAMKIHEIFQVNDSLNIWLTSVADDRDTATIGSEFFINYRLAKGDPILTDKRNKSKIFMLKEKIFSYSLRIVTKKGFPFLQHFNRVISQMKTFGLIQALFHRYSSILDKVKAMQKHDKVVKKLSLYHLQGAFALLGLGYCIALLLFCLEFMLNYKNHNCAQKKRN